MYAHVLVGTDGSSTAATAVHAAARLAAAHSAELSIVHAFKSGRSAPEVDASLPAEFRWMSSPGAIADAIVQDAVDRARPIVRGGGRIAGRAVAGDPVRVLLAMIDKVGADVLVVGNADLRSRFTRSAVGLRLSRRAHCDVVIVDTLDRSQRRFQQVA